MSTFKMTTMCDRHVMAVHSNVAGLQCSAEQCNLTFKWVVIIIINIIIFKCVFRRLADVREHIRAAHSVKHPVARTHYSDLYLQQPVIQVVGRES